MFKPLDPIIHSELRLSIISLLIGSKSLEFSFIKKATGASSGNLSVSLTKLKEAEYIDIKKSFKGNFPLTEISITEKGVLAFEIYVENLKDYINKN